jgi:O-antigen ligase
MTKILDRQNFAWWADWFAVAVAVVLPWSTTCTAVFIVLWLISLLGSWNIAERFREPWLAVGYLPALLWLVAALGVLWDSAPWAERFAALSAFHKLLAIPFFAIQFRDSHRRMWVLIAFLISCTVLLVIGPPRENSLPQPSRSRYRGMRLEALPPSE